MCIFTDLRRTARSIALQNIIYLFFIYFFLSLFFNFNNFFQIRIKIHEDELLLVFPKKIVSE